MVEQEALLAAARFAKANSIPATGPRHLFRHPDGLWLFVFGCQVPQDVSRRTRPPNHVALIGVDNATGVADLFPLIPFLRQQLAHEVHRTNAWLQGSQIDKTSDTQGLAAIGRRAVEVRELAPDLLKGPDGSPANGTTVRSRNKYFIFVNDSLRTSGGGAPVHLRSYERRHVILHEYGHILNGDLYSDYPWSAVWRFWFSPAEYARSERAADGYAADRQAKELAASGDQKGAAAWRDAIEQYNWIVP